MYTFVCARVKCTDKPSGVLTYLVRLYLYYIITHVDILIQTYVYIKTYILYRSHSARVQHVSIQYHDG